MGSANHARIEQSMASLAAAMTAMALFSQVRKHPEQPACLTGRGAAASRADGLHSPWAHHYAAGHCYTLHAMTFYLQSRPLLTGAACDITSQHAKESHPAGSSRGGTCCAGEGGRAYGSQRSAQGQQRHLDRPGAGTTVEGSIGAPPQDAHSHASECFQGRSRRPLMSVQRVYMVP